MPSTTGLQLVTDAFVTIGVVRTGATLNPGMANDGLRRLNAFVGALAMQPLTMPAIAREVFALDDEVGIYTIGPGGDFDTARPIWVTGAGLLLNNNLTPLSVTSITRSGNVATVTTATSHGAATGQNVTISGASPASYNGTFPIIVTGATTFTYLFGGAESSASGTIAALIESNLTSVVETPIPVVTNDARQWNQVKSLTSTLVTALYYNQTYTAGLGTINLWPIPTVTTNALVLYSKQAFVRFSSLTATYDLPDGAEEVLLYGLARRFLTPYAVTDAATVEDVHDLARTSMGLYKRANSRLRDLPVDPALTQSHRGGYNINTGTGG